MSVPHHRPRTTTTAPARTYASYSAGPSSSSAVSKTAASLYDPRMAVTAAGMYNHPPPTNNVSRNNGYYPTTDSSRPRATSSSARYPYEPRSHHELPYEPRFQRPAPSYAETQERFLAAPPRTARHMSARDYDDAYYDDAAAGMRPRTSSSAYPMMTSGPYSPSSSSYYRAAAATRTGAAFPRPVFG